MGLTQSHSGLLDDVEGFVQKIPGSHEREKPINISGNAKVLLKCVCSNGSFVNSIREPIFCCFGLDKPPGHQI